MAVKLRLTRIGKKKQPYYRIVAVDSRAPRDGKYLEKIGHYNPLPNPEEVLIDEQKVFYWLRNGAIPTDTVRNLFSKQGIMLKWSFMKKGYDDEQVEEEYNKWEVLQLERQKKQEALAAQTKRDAEDKEEKEKEAEQEAKPEVEENPTEKKPEAVETKAEEIPIEEKAETAESKVEEIPTDEKTEAVETEQTVDQKEADTTVLTEEASEVKSEESQADPDQPIAETEATQSDEQAPESKKETDSN